MEESVHHSRALLWVRATKVGAVTLAYMALRTVVCVWVPLRPRSKLRVMSYPAQHDNCFISFVKVWAQSFRPSTMVR